MIGQIIEPGQRAHDFSRYLYAFAAIWLTVFAYFYIAGQHRVPYEDDWDILYFVRFVDQGDVTLALLFEQFSGIHRVVIGRLLMCIEYLVFNGTGYFPNLVSFFSLACSYILFIKNLQLAGLPEQQKQTLYFIGILVIFSCSQLFIFNYTWACFQHPQPIFLSILCFHLINRDVRSGKTIGIPNILVYLFLLGLACIGTAAGLFSIGAAAIGLLLARIPLKSLLVFFVGAALLAIPLIPGDVIFRTGDDAFIGSLNDYMSKMNLGVTNSWVNLPLFILLYFGAPVSAVWQTGGFIAGFAVLVFSLGICIRNVLSWSTRFLFFQMMLYMCLAFGIATAIGRHDILDSASNGRFYVMFGWTIWTVMFFLITLAPRRIFLAVMAICVIFSLLGSYKSAWIEVQKNRNTTLAKINLINRSYIHMTYHIISFQHKLLGFNPSHYFDSYLRSKKWGTYSNHIDDVKILQRNNDACEAKPIGRWLVSEKQFFEYRLDGWNTTLDQSMPKVYALDTDGKIVAYGETITREPEWLRTNWLPRERVQIYMVIPTNYDLAQLTLLGGDDGSFCTIHH